MNLRNALPKKRLHLSPDMQALLVWKKKKEKPEFSNCPKYIFWAWQSCFLTPSSCLGTSFICRSILGFYNPIKVLVILQLKVNKTGTAQFLLTVVFPWQACAAVNKNLFDCYLWLCFWKRLPVATMLFFLTGKLPWSTLSMTPCFPDKWIEAMDLFLGLSSK